MAITEIQSASAKADNADTKPTVGWDNTPTTGNLLVCLVGWSQSKGAASVSLSGWTQVPTDGDVNNTGFVHMGLFYKQAGGGESKTVKATLTAARRWTIEVVEVHSSTSTAGWQPEVSSHSSGSSNTPSSGTTGTTGTADEYWVAGFAAQNKTTLSSPTNGFTIKEQQVPGNQGTEYVSGALLTKIVTATGTASTGGTYSNSRPWVGAIATFHTVVQTIYGGGILTGAGTLNATAYYPTATLLVQAAFGYGPGDPNPVFSNITTYVKSCQWQRGRQNELNQTQAGTATVVLNDEDSHFDPNNTLSPFYPYVKPGLPVRAILFVGSDVYPLFYGFAERLPRTSRISNVYTQRQLELVDGFAILANAGMGGFGFLSEPSHTRVTLLLDAIRWPATKRRIGTGASTLVEVGFAPNDDTRAQNHLQQVADSENGLLFCNGAGDLVFIGRHELISDPAYTVSQATFQDVNS